MTFGVEPQKMKLIEECSELVTAMARERCQRATWQDIITELADVSIMVEQMALLYGYEDFKAERDRKMKRLQERIISINQNEGAPCITLK